MMKHKGIAVLLALALLGCGCSSEKDSNKQADETNDQNIEKTNDSTAATMKSADSEKGQKGVAEYLVVLTNTGLTELAMSRFVGQKTRNADLKTYARRVISEHASEQNNLTEQAKKYGIVLPTILSIDSQTRLSTLRGETGADLDQRYLEYMLFINDIAVTKAKNLIRDTDSPELKTVVQKRMASDQKHIDEAKRLQKKYA